mgnify:CR=1 FL=1
MRRMQAGFSLAEMVVAMAVIAILAGVALPAYRGAREAAYAGAARAAVGESLLKAISHAALTGSEVVLCPGDANGCRASIDWSHGWMAFADLDGDRQRTPNETLLHEQLSLGGNVHLRSTIGRTRLVFQPNGGNAGSNVTFTVCDGRGPAKAVALVIANDGRLRNGVPTRAATEACMHPMP